MNLFPVLRISGERVTGNFKKVEQRTQNTRIPAVFTQAEEAQPEGIRAAGFLDATRDSSVFRDGMMRTAAGCFIPLC